MTALVLGIDEAGRGPAVGPMVLAAVALEPGAARRLRRAGVADSKSFGAGAAARALRAALADEVRRLAAYVAESVCAAGTVDDYVARQALNVLERERALALVRRAPTCRRIVADGRSLFAPLRQLFPHLEARDRGEAVHVAVAAASLIAKVRRDELFAEIALRWQVLAGPILGGGYANAHTRAWTRRFVRVVGVLPPEARLSWPWPRWARPPGARPLSLPGLAAPGPHEAE